MRRAAGVGPTSRQPAESARWAGRHPETRKMSAEVVVAFAALEDDAVGELQVMRRQNAPFPSIGTRRGAARSRPGSTPRPPKSAYPRGWKGSPDGQTGSSDTRGAASASRNGREQQLSRPALERCSPSRAERISRTSRETATNAPRYLRPDQDPEDTGGEGRGQSLPLPSRRLREGTKARKKKKVKPKLDVGGGESEERTWLARKSRTATTATGAARRRPEPAIAPSRRSPNRSDRLRHHASRRASRP